MPFPSSIGYITTCYPTEAEKGKYIATSWVLNASGSIVGAGMFFSIYIYIYIYIPTFPSINDC